MPKYIGYFLFGAIFTLGLSVGTYMALEQNNEGVQVEPENIVPIQDVVIRNVQNEEKENETKIIETVVTETKLSPYAMMTIEKKFLKCGHTTVEVIDLPNELINMTELEILEKFENWEVRSFSAKELSLYREINANCNDHFVIKEKDGFLAIYNEITKDTMNLKEVTDIDVSCLPSGEFKLLENGIHVYRPRKAI